MENIVMYSVLEGNKKSKDAGPKAKRDINHFLAADGFKVWNLDLPISHLDKILFRYLKLPKLFKGNSPDNLVFQYPVYSLFLTQQIIQQVRRKTKANLIFMIHDVEALRVYVDDSKFAQAEIAIFNAVDVLIVHNQKMKAYLKKQGVKTKMVVLEIFDYYNPQSLQMSKEYNRSICFAGNLEKADFLEKVNFKQVKLNIYGPNPHPVYPEAVNYCGAYAPDELPTHLKENFGLIWDGDSLEQCQGVFGNYMRYNNPHKTSLYLSSGIPVIIWKQAALADFVQKYQVGLVVESLTEVDELLSELTVEEYYKLKENTLRLAERLRSGDFIKTAIAQALKGAK